MEAIDKCLQLIESHVIFEDGAWWIMDNDNERLDGPWGERYEDDLEIASMEFAVEYAEDWWRDLEEDDANINA